MLLSRLVGILTVCLVAGATKPPSRRNVTIDDHFGDEMTHAVPVYTPSDKWDHEGSHPWALTPPNASLAYNETWHAPNLKAGTKAVSFGFTGVAIYVYCIVFRIQPSLLGANSLASYKFSIDGVPVGRYKPSLEEKGGYDYNVLVYANTTLEDVAHNFSITADSLIQILPIFDYAIYTITTNSSMAPPYTSTSATDPPVSLKATSTASFNTSTVTPEEANASESHQNTGPIVGATLAGLSAFVLMGTVIYHRRKKSGSRQQLPSQQWRRSRFLRHTESWPPAPKRHADDGKVDCTPIHSPVRDLADIEKSHM
ncbi:hypothetical protein EYR40_008595 [Pleurotus pulmonarius]|nr:hypothetical protein EYR36_009414 [Pleurotus pulmonarius]KAF4592911.1 hypothetical protein EYR38_008617 [Pleurotus pulmonarius]KAF4593801.1 hypothetical protein EYR40_008595 [Pleurotus pulmonarius]